MLKSLSVRVLVALVAGLLLGAAAAEFGGPLVRAGVENFEAVGSLWLNALQMTVIPLLFSVLVVGVAGVADAAATGRLALKAIGWFAAFLLVGCAWTLAFGHGFYAQWPVDPGAATALAAAAPPPPAGVAATPTFGDFLKGLAPTNPIKAAAEDAILPLVMFAIAFAFALTRLPEPRRLAVTGLFQSIADAMVVIVRWVLWAAPVGVFALCLGVGLRAGVGAAGVIGHYIVAVVLAQVGVIAIAAAVAMAWGRAPAGLWLRALAPVQATAVATQSSLACLPAMIEESRRIGLPERVVGLVLPLAVSVFKLTSPVANLAVALFVAQVYGVEPSALQFASAVVIALAVSVASIGLPGQVSFFMSVGPICLALGLPLDLLPILIAVEVVPDIFRTIGNVTGDMAVASLVARDQPLEAHTPTAAAA